MLFPSRISRGKPRRVGNGALLLRRLPMRWQVASSTDGKAAPRERPVSQQPAMPLFLWTSFFDSQFICGGARAEGRTRGS
jgi:hypothetical protein